MKHISLLIVLLVSFLSFSQNKNSEKNHFQLAGEVIKTGFLTIPSDFSYMGNAITKDWKTSLAYTGGMAALVLLDKPTTKFWQNHIETNVDYHLPDIRIGNQGWPWLNHNTEDAYVSYSLIGLYVGSLATKYEKGQYVFINAFKALTYSEIFTQLILKTISGRQRPHRYLDDIYTPKEPFTNNPYDFFNKRDKYLFSSPYGSSFPSLHATAFFAMAKVAQMEFDNYWVPYGALTLFFMSNVKAHNHWFSDLVGGALVGTIIGRSVVKSSWEKRGIIKDKKKLSFKVIPNLSKDFQGLHIVGDF
ncbi:phosphatase PAP2 family protein [Flavobacteriaceae bacterium]|nr:phosphatase PAP2 family protein [Flavobacteriaceae bacterium]